MRLSLEEPALNFTKVRITSTFRDLQDDRQNHHPENLAKEPLELLDRPSEDAIPETLDGENYNDHDEEERMPGFPGQSCYFLAISYLEPGSRTWLL